MNEKVASGANGEGPALSHNASDLCLGGEACRDDTLRRLRRIEGQVRGIQRMLQDQRECGDVLTQLLAIRSGVDEVSLQIVDLHLERCVLAGVELDRDKRLELLNAMRLMLRVPRAASAAE